MALMEGFVDYFHDGVFSDKWESRYLRFYDDSMMEIYEKKDGRPDIKVCMTDVCEFLCVGHYTKNVPGKPKLPAHSNTALVFCFPRDHDRKEKEIIWLMANSMDMLNDWMKTMISSFPGGANDVRERKKREERRERRDRDYEREYNSSVKPSKNEKFEVYQDPNRFNDIPSVMGWNFIQANPNNGNPIGFGTGWAKFNPGYEAPPPTVINNITNNITNNYYGGAPPAADNGSKKDDRDDDRDRDRRRRDSRDGSRDRGRDRDDSRDRRRRRDSRDDSRDRRRRSDSRDRRRRDSRD